MTFTFRVPPPPHDLSPNRAGKDCRYLTKLKGQMRGDWKAVIVSTRNAMRPYPPTPVFPGRVVAEIVYGKPRGGKDWDPDNLIATIKHGLDQLEKQGIISNDRYLDPIVKEQVRDPEGIGYVEIVITEAS